MNEFNHKKTELIKYLQLYLSKKNLRMNYVVKGIYKRLKSDQRITQKQFNSLMKFLEREPKFVSKNREQIFQYFNSLILSNRDYQFPKENNKYESNTLTQFFT